MSLLLYFHPEPRDKSFGVEINQTSVNSVDETLICFIYNAILPIICFFGLIGNGLSYLVLMKIEIKCSSYTYLRVLTASDFIQCSLIIISTVIKVFVNEVNGEDFDMLIILPVAAIFSGISCSATVFVTLDRMLLLRNPTRTTRAPFCRPEVARRVMMLAVFISVIFNLPFFFIYQLNDDWNLRMTFFLKSRCYFIYTWVRFAFYGIIPALVLPIMTGVLIYHLNQVRNQLRHLSCKRKTEVLASTRMTVTLISIVFFFLVGEIPGHIISKKAAFIFLYSGDPDMITSGHLQTVRQVALILGALKLFGGFYVVFLFASAVL